MDDQAKIVFELVDRSGPGAAATSPNIPGSGQIPGSSLAQDFQQKVTASGAGANLGAGSYTPTPAPPITPSDAVKPTGDPLLSTVQGIIGADPTAKPEELQKALGITSERATDLLAAARGSTEKTEQRSAPGPTPTTPKNEPTSALPEGPLSQFFTSTPAQREAEQRFGSDEVAKAAEAQRLLQQRAAANTEDALNQSEKEAGRQSKDINKHQERYAREFQEALLQQHQRSRDAISNATGVIDDLFHNTGARSLLGRIPGGGEVSNLITTALRAGPGIASAVAGPSNALAGTGLGTAASPIIAELVGGGGLAAAAGPIAAVGAAALAVPIGATIAAFHEADRATQVARYSPELAQARAEATVRQVLADLRSSQRLGQVAADYTESTSRISTAAQGTIDTLTKPFLEELMPLLRIYANYAEWAQRAWNSPGAQAALNTIASGLIGGKRLEWVLEQLGILSEESKRANDMFHWFDKQEIPPLPGPFASMKMNDTAGAEFIPVAGLKL
jgi:hypothetical protein